MEKGEIVRTAEPKTLFQILSVNFLSLLVPLNRIAQNDRASPRVAVPNILSHDSVIYPKRVIVQIQAVVGRALPVREPSSPPIKRSMASRPKLSQGLGLLDMYT
ncbi:hypothetical protein BDV39DRAFT_137608 [Aspergillus sergii]|uniref:Uncharacterized protein n=1 Tax=Aspergillus sergii TaxID=1034303 RepID=A0A5N6XFP8_9EURO|nr:hypothetical protein BDV39DRAFT_137608 [Aspergillus sergii]